VCGICVKICPFDAPRPKAFILDHCTGCRIFAEVCPVDTTSGGKGSIHAIDQTKCIPCGICTDKCPVQAIDGTFNAAEVIASAAKAKETAHSF